MRATSTLFVQQMRNVIASDDVDDPTRVVAAILLAEATGSSPSQQELCSILDWNQQRMETAYAEAIHNGWIKAL